MKKIFIYLFIGLLPYHSFSQDSSGRIDERFLKIIVHIKIPQINAIGSGFLVSVSNGGDSEKIYLVTNKHMIGSYSLVDPLILYDNIIVDFYSKNGNTPIPTLVNIKDSNGIKDNLVILHPNPKVDVAIINVSKYFVRNNNLIPFTCDTSFLMRLNYFPSIYLGFGSQVFAIGYPANFMIAGTNQPIGKAAYIASSTSGNLKINFPFTNRRGIPISTSPEGKFFLVDGLIIGGNSGGPIVNPKEYKWHFIKEGFVRSHDVIQNLILGIVSMGVPGTGLTAIYSSDNILDLIKQDN